MEGKKMKKKTISILLCMILSFSMGCATLYPVGAIFTDVRLPITATGNDIKATKVGKASCSSSLMLFAIGDASIQAAMKNGGITKIHHVDYKVVNILGLVGEFTTIFMGNKAPS